MADEVTTEADVADAEQAQRVAEDLALTLEQRLVTGDDEVTPDQLEAQRSLARYAVLRVQGVKAKLAATREAKRRQDLADLRAEIDAYTADSGASLARDLQAFLDAREKFIADAAAHDALVTGWTQRAQALNAPQIDGSLVTTGLPSGVALGRVGIESLVVGKRRLRRVEGKTFLNETVLAGIERGYAGSVYVANLQAIDGDEADA